MTRPLLLTTILVLLQVSNLRAEQGEPLAVRFWPQGVVSIETHWDFEVVVSLTIGPALDADLKDADLLLSAADVDGSAFDVRARTLGIADDVAPSTPFRVELPKLDYFLDRLPNQAVLTLTPSSDVTFVSENAVHISQRSGNLLMIVVDGVRLAIPLKHSFAEEDDLLEIDALLFPMFSSWDEKQSAVARASIATLNPRLVAIPASAEKLIGSESGEKVSVLARTLGNTFAISHRERADGDRQWLPVSDKPWTMPQELEELFAKKEQSCDASQEVFAKLSVAQMNFKPGDGTHTPRWNAEHMMGRELLFFSQIYAKQEAAIEPMDLNPKQMPPDYEAAHSDWDGTEEARQMQRVSAFTRRFAYLLDGLDLDQKAPGSFWTPRGLLVQMVKHYDGHTANVLKKFALTDWPKE